jgi:hypothetical protein
MRITNTGSVGIGTSNPNTLFHLSDTAGGAIIRLERDDTTISDTNIYGGIEFEGQDGSAGSAAGVRGKILGVAEGATGEMALTFETAGGYDSSIERLRINSSGFVGIGTSNPVSTLNISHTDAFPIRIARSTAGQSAIRVTNGGGNNVDIINDGANNFLINNTGSERLRIDSSGKLLVGTTATVYSGGEKMSIDGGSASGLGIATTTASTQLLGLWNAATSGTRHYVRFAIGADGNEVGTITSTGTTTAYNTSSDARLKDVTGSARGLEVINELNPVAYNWKVDGQADEGLIAQEVIDIVPNAVTGSEEDMYSMDYSKLVVHLVAGMKEQQAQIDALQSEINLLKGE